MSLQVQLGSAGMSQGEEGSIAFAQFWVGRRGSGGTPQSFQKSLLQEDALNHKGILLVVSGRVLS